MNHKEEPFTFETNQEAFWAGQFGVDYINRNDATPQAIASNLFFFANILRNVSPVPESIIEFGSNIGLNLRALKLLLPNANLSAVEINSKAVDRLRKDRVANEIYHESLLVFNPSKSYDLAFMKGVSIHIPPEHLPNIYRKLGSCSSRYILIAEYYSRNHEEVCYRGHDDKLFRGDFGSLFLEMNPQFILVDYGFSYHGDAYENQGDITWFLFRRNG